MQPIYTHRLNPDILHHIAESCRDRRTYISCSLVCRTWQEVFVRYIFRSIRVNGHARLESLLRLLDDKPHVCSWIQVLICQGSAKEIPRNRSLIPLTIGLLSEKLICVHTWKIDHCGWSYKGDVNHTPFYLWSSVKTLSIKDSHFDGEAFRILLCTLPKLRHFQSLNDTSLIKPATYTLAAAVARTPLAPHLTRICMDVYTLNRMMDRIFFGRWANLSEIQIVSPPKSPPPQLHRLFSMLGSRLLKLGLYQPDVPGRSRDAFTDVAAMQLCTSLQTFTWNNLSSSLLHTMLKELPKPYMLRQLGFSLPTVFLPIQTPQYIAELDDFLTEEFTELRLIEIRYNGLASLREARTRVQRYFPKSARRGIMKIIKTLKKET
ncbi:hypothetical protein C8Q75DRAFT_407143 [Abortiporus biennis]|nr:hypothetical protein C8Q75DRAFT_407143 [Abortiporus biennis]